MKKKKKTNSHYRAETELLLSVQYKEKYTMGDFVFLTMFKISVGQEDSNGYANDFHE